MTPRPGAEFSGWTGRHSVVSIGVFPLYFHFISTLFPLYFHFISRKILNYNAKLFLKSIPSQQLLIEFPTTRISFKNRGKWVELSQLVLLIKYGTSPVGTSSCGCVDGSVVVVSCSEVVSTVALFMPSRCSQAKIMGGFNMHLRNLASSKCNAKGCTLTYEQVSSPTSG